MTAVGSVFTAVRLEPYVEQAKSFPVEMLGPTEIYRVMDNSITNQIWLQTIANIDQL